MEVSCGWPDVFDVERCRRHRRVVWFGLDRPAGGVRAGRSHLGRVRRLRRPCPLPGRCNRRAAPARLRHGRHHQGVRDGRPRWLSARIRGFPRRPPEGAGDRPAQAGGALGPRRGRHRAAAVEQRLGRISAGCRRPPVRGWREQPVPRGAAEPVLRGRRPGGGRPGTRVGRGGLGRRPAGRGGDERVDRELARDRR